MTKYQKKLNLFKNLSNIFFVFLKNLRLFKLRKVEKLMVVHSFVKNCKLLSAVNKAVIF